MSGAHPGRFADFEQQINEAMREVALDLRSVDVIDFASFIHTLKLANVGDLINSSLELYFRPQTLIFSYSGDVELTWFGRPSVGLDMELHCAGIDVYFRLTIEALSVGIQINCLSLDGEVCHEPCDPVRFSKAIEAARIPFAHGPQNFANPQPDRATLPT
jgi:hypothetical protein